jgi:hypothetical protein
MILRYLFCIIISLFLLLPFPALADNLSDLKEMVLRQQREIEALSQKVEDIKDDSESRFGWNLGLLGDVNYSTISRERERGSFYIGELVLFSTGSYGERLTFLAEIAFEQEEREADIERVWAGYTVNDLLTVRAGKFHTALGYWNKAYHHGKQFFHTVDRPFFLAFEHDGGVVPTHITGVEMEGSGATGVGRFKYELQLGNGPVLLEEESHNILDPNDTSDDNNAKQPALRVSLRPSAIQGLSAGLFATTYEVDTPTRKGVEETIYGIDLSYSREGLEIISEVFLFRNPDGDGNAFYAQLAYLYDPWIPYIRFERLDAERGDPYFDGFEGGMDRSQTIAGLRYDIDPVTSSLKFQYRRDDGNRDYDVFEAQWAFHF